MEDHLIISGEEHKMLKKFKTRLERRHHVVINIPDSVEYSEFDVIFVSIIGEKCDIENIKKFLSTRMKAKSEKVASQKNVLLITLSDSEDNASLSDSESKENSVSDVEEVACANNCLNLEDNASLSDSELKENSVCIMEEVTCTNNRLNLVQKAEGCNPLDDSVCIIDCTEIPPVTDNTSLPNVNKRKPKHRRGRFKNKRARMEDVLATHEVEVCEIPSTVYVCEVSSTTEETVKKVPPMSEKPADFIPLGLMEEKKKSKEDRCEVDGKTSDVILLEEPIPAPRPLRPIVIDGSNVAMEHGKVSHCFSAKGIQLAIEYFLKRGHTDVHAFVPKFRRISNPNHNFPTKDPEILDELAAKQLVVFTPSRRVNGKCIASYDDRFIVELASTNGGVIVSNDNYRDLMEVSDSFKETIEKRLLMFCFVGDLIMIPSDPLGRNGPSLEEFLSFPPESQT